VVLPRAARQRESRAPARALAKARVVLTRAARRRESRALARAKEVLLKVDLQRESRALATAAPPKEVSMLIHAAKSMSTHALKTPPRAEMPVANMFALLHVLAVAHRG
jgi:hypothetical protein